MSTTIIFEDAQSKDAALQESIDAARAAVVIQPSDASTHDELLALYKDARDLWRDCETRLRDYGKTHADCDKKELAAEITLAHEMYEQYFAESKEALTSKLEHTSKTYRAARTAKTAGKAMQDAGKAMSAAGDNMTRGCTIPLIIALLLAVILFALAM